MICRPVTIETSLLISEEDESSILLLILYITKECRTVSKYIKNSLHAVSSICRQFCDMQYIFVGLLYT